MVDGERHEPGAVTALQLLDHGRMMLARVRKQLRVANSVPADSSCLHPQFLDRLGQVLIRTRRPDAAVKRVVQHVDLQQVACVELAAVLLMNRFDLRKRIGPGRHRPTARRLALQDHPDLVDLLDLLQGKVPHDHPAVGPARDQSHPFEMHQRRARHMPRHAELRADLFFHQSLMRPQTSNDDVRLDAFDQLRRLCVGFRDQTCSLGSFLGGFSRLRPTLFVPVARIGRPIIWHAFYRLKPATTLAFTLTKINLTKLSSKPRLGLHEPGATRKWPGKRIDKGCGDMNRRADTNGIQTHHVLTGKPGAPTVILSHGLAADLSMWEPQLDTLSRNFSVLTYDIRGHGGSSATPGDYSLALLAQDVVTLLDHLGVEKAHYIGLSLGGMIGQYLGAWHGERLASLTLCATTSEAPKASWEARVLEAREIGVAPLVEATVDRWVTPE